MSNRKSFGLAACAAVGLLSVTTGSAHTQCGPSSETTLCATEWSGGPAINLEGSMSSRAYGINNAEQVVGESVFGGLGMATEWSGDSIINLGSLPGSTSSVALAINGSGKAVRKSSKVGQT